MLRCQIQVFNPPEGNFRPMQRVRGTIKYTVYEALLIKKIVVSLKGNGVLDVKGKARRKFKESYVDIAQTIQEDSKGFILGVGTYVENFNFDLPMNIPGSIEIRKETFRHKVDCRIQYYVRIKFDRGYWKADKTFKKNIIVKPLLIPSLPLEPMRYEKFKQLKAFVYAGIVRIIAAIENSVIYGRDTIVIHYKLQNNTNTSLVRVSTSLVQVYSFKPNRPFINAKSYTDLEGTISMSDHIDSGASVTDTVEIEVPDSYNVSTLEHSTLVTRNYYVKIVVQLPYPHSDIILEIPVQIGDNRGSRDDTCEDSVRMTNENGCPVYSGPPPSYWETMGEMPPVETEDDATCEEDAT